MKIEWTTAVALRRVELWIDDFYVAHIQQIPDMSWVILLWTTSDSRWVPQEVSCDNLETAKVVAVALVVMR